MKKVMLFSIALLFSVGANAANITIDNTLADKAPLINTFSNDSPLVVYTWEGGTGTIGIKNDVTADVTGNVKVTWTFNPSALSGHVIQFNPSTGIDGLVNVAGASSYSDTFNLEAGKTYHMNFEGTVLKGSSIALSVQSLSQVPVPAALWLFTPALVGLIGLRRKSTKGLVVA